MQLRNPEVLRGLVGVGPGRIMTGAELARKIGKSRSTIDHLLNGRMTRCKPEVAVAIEDALDVPSGLLFVPRDIAEKPVLYPRDIIEKSARHNTQPLESTT